MTLVAVGACADTGPRRIAPPPPLDGAALAAGPGPSAFAGAVAAPPDLKAFAARASRGAGSHDLAEENTVAPAPDRTAAPISAREGDAHSVLTRLGATAAPFSAPGKSVASVSASLARGEGSVGVAGVGPTRTAMRVRPITPPFSGPRRSIEEPAQPAQSYASLAAAGEPSAMPFVGTRSARDVLRDDTVSGRPPAVAQPPFTPPPFASTPFTGPGDTGPEPAAPGFASADTSVFGYPAPPTPQPEPSPWPATGAYAAATEPAYAAGAERALDHPLFMSAGEAFATVIVSNSGVEVVAEETARDRLVFASLPADPGGWAGEDRLVTEVSAGSVEPGIPAPAGQMIATLHFDDGAVEFGDAERQILREVARIQKIGNRLVTLVGHASGRTHASNTLAQQRTNMRISRQRAESAERTLAAFGVPRSKMHVVPAGDTQPLYAEVMPAGEAGNRRVEVYLDD